MTSRLAEIARQAWLECPLDEDHWEAAAQAVRDAVIERQLLSERKWRPIDDEAKNGKPHLFICRWDDQTGYAEEQIVLRWDPSSTSPTNRWLDWEETALHIDVPVLYCDLPPSPINKADA